MLIVETDSRIIGLSPSTEAESVVASLLRGRLLHTPHTRGALKLLRYCFMPSATPDSSTE